MHTRAPEPQPQPRGAGGEEEGLGPTQVRAAVAPASGVWAVGGHGSRGWHTTSWSLEEGSLPGPCGRKAGSLQGPPPPKRLQGPVCKPARKDWKENGITFKGTEAGGQTHSPCFLDLQQDAPSLVQRAAAERKSGELNPRQTHSPRPSARDRPGPRSPALLQALTTPRQVTPTPQGRAAGSKGRPDSGPLPSGTAGPHAEPLAVCVQGTRGPVLGADTMGRGRPVCESGGPGKPGHPGADRGAPAALQP